MPAASCGTAQLPSRVEREGVCLPLPGGRVLLGLPSLPSLILVAQTSSNLAISASCCFLSIPRLEAESMERASMDYEAPLMPCGCILVF